MDDLISRQVAIDAINHICPVDTEYDCTLLDRVDVRCVLSDLQSAQPRMFEGEDVDSLISKLSEIRSDYNCFDKDEEPYYHALSEAIKILYQLWCKDE